MTIATPSGACYEWLGSAWSFDHLFTVSLPAWVWEFRNV